MTTFDADPQIVLLLGPEKGLFRDPLPADVLICRDRAEVEAAISRPAKHATWISFTRQLTDILLEKAVGARDALKGAHLITLTPPRSGCSPALLGLFHPVFGLVDGFRWLPKKELVEAIVRDDAADRFLGGSVDPKAKALVLVRGDMTSVIAPFSIFARSGDGTTPDFARLRLTDYGRTVVLGDYEASADAILYELDPIYRRRLKKQRRHSERTFGASLLRLRKERRLTRGDFGPISSREIGRIERNEIARPHAKTLQTIAAWLGVRPEEIEEY